MSDSEIFTLRAPFLAGLFVVVSLLVSWYLKGDPLLDAIPTVGFSDPILSYFSALRLNVGRGDMVKEGYKKTRPGLFKVATFWRWMVMVCGPELIDDIRKAPDNVLSIREPIDDLVQTDYTLDLLNKSDSYHTDIIRSKLTRNIAVTFKEVHEESIHALEDLIPTAEDKWVKVPIMPTIEQVVCSTSNRVFVGVPLCRNLEYLELNMTFAVNVVKFGMIIGLFPKPLKPIVARMLSNLPSQIQKEMDFIRPMVEERFAKMEEFGDEWDKPNDMLMWLMSEAKGVERSLGGLARRLLTVNLAAIRTTSRTTVRVLYRLLSHPEYIEPLRQEVEAVVAQEGWTKTAMDKMHKIDSFLRETQRLDNIGDASMTRLALLPFTFSNGVTIPAGTLVSIPGSAAHTDEESIRTLMNSMDFDSRSCGKVEGMPAL